ncbi:three-helix bundle dimerization domain-containing protein [Kitasatospora cinereorecta]
MAQIARRLHQHFDAALGPAEVERALDAARRRFTHSPGLHPRPCGTNRHRRPPRQGTARPDAGSSAPAAP